MTWHEVKLNVPKGGLGTSGIGLVFYDYLHPRKQWCMDNLSSKGVLWKHDYNRHDVFYFAQPQDAIMFKLKFGL